MKLGNKQFTIPLLVLVGAAALGALVGFFVGSQTTPGFSLGAPPEPVAQIASANTFDITVQTTGNHYYRCAAEAFSQGAGCWQTTGAPGEKTRDILNQPQIDDAKFAPPPGKIREHWTVTFYDSIGGFITESRYALLEDGTVWVWQADTSQFLNVSLGVEQALGAGVGLCCMSLLGLLVALLLGFILARTAKTSTAS